MPNKWFEVLQSMFKHPVCRGAGYMEIYITGHEAYIGSIHNFFNYTIPDLSSPGVSGVPWHPQILADQLTLSKQGGADYAHHITTGTPGFSNLPKALNNTVQWDGSVILTSFLVQTAAEVHPGEPGVSK